MTIVPKRAWICIIAFCATIGLTETVSAAEVTMIASNALRQAYLELLPQYEKASGNRVTVIWSPAVNVASRVEGGTASDLVILPADGLEALIAKGLVVTGSRTDVAKSLIGVAVRLGAPRPDLSSAEGLRNSLLASRSIVISGGTSSFYLKELFATMGIAKRIAPYLSEYGPGSGLGVGDVLARGDGDLGFTQVNGFVGRTDIDYVGPLPPEIQQVTIFSAGLTRSATAPEAANSLVRFLSSPETAPVLHKYGLDPAR